MCKVKQSSPPTYNRTHLLAVVEQSCHPCDKLSKPGVGNRYQLSLAAAPHCTQPKAPNCLTQHTSVTRRHSPLNSHFGLGGTGGERQPGAARQPPEPTRHVDSDVPTMASPTLRHRC